MSLNTTPRTWVTGEFVTAAMLNTEIRDALSGAQSAWTAYTPTWSAPTTPPALGNGILTGAYCQIGKSIWWRLALTMGSTTTYGSGNYTFTLPFTPATVLQGQPMGTATIVNGAVKPGSANFNAGSAVYVIRASTEALINQAGAGAAWAAGHTVQLLGCYERS